MLEKVKQFSDVCLCNLNATNLLVLKNRLGQVMKIYFVKIFFLLKSNTKMLIICFVELLSPYIKYAIPFKRKKDFNSKMIQLLILEFSIFK